MRRRRSDIRTLEPPAGGTISPVDYAEAEGESLEDQLRRHAHILNARRWRWPFVGPEYHLFADALFWADEAPPWSGLRQAEDPLRILWHYRTGLIMGEPRPFGELWELGLQLFPRWVGFHPSRRARRAGSD